ncbi:10712_t:CDS:10 [Entrophospora sp. SA101]|nr:10712_t:CDS:10 [Entrophospora sp. SA101]
MPNSLQLDNITSAVSTTVSATASMLFSPLATRAVKGDTASILSELAPQLMDQRRILQYANGNARQTGESTNSRFITLDEISLKSKFGLNSTSSEVSLDVEIPESKAPLSLFQGYKMTCSELEISVRKKGKLSKKRAKGYLTDGFASPDVLSDNDYDYRPLNKLIADRDRVVKETDQLAIQGSRAIAEIKKIEEQIIELSLKKQNLGNDLIKYNERQIELSDQLEELNESIKSISNYNHIEKGSYKIKGKNASKHKYEPGTCIKTLEGHNDMIICLDFDKYDGLLVTSSLDNTLRIWDLSSKTCLGLLNNHHDIVTCLQINDNYLITGSRDKTICYWDISKAKLNTNSSDSINVNSVSSITSPLTSSTIITTNATNQFSELSNIGGDCFIERLEGHHDKITCLYSEGNCLVTGSSDKTMKQWDLETGKCILTMDVLWAMSNFNVERRNYEFFLDDYSFGSGEFVGALQFKDVGLASGTEDEHFLDTPTWDLRTGSVIESYSYEHSVTSLKFDSQRIFNAAGSNDIKIYNRKSFQHSSFNGHSSPVHCLKFKDTILLSGGKDNLVKIWAL